MSINKEQGLSKRNAELEKELAAKNSELEIQSALERVRTTAMAMKEPADMLYVCRMISDQLLQLGFKEVLNVQTVIIYPQRHEHLNYQYFTPYDKDLIEVIDYRLHPDVLNFTNQMLASTDAYYTKTFEGKELNDWREYRNQTNQLPDPKLGEAASSHHYFYSIGSGALGVTTYAPLSEKEISLFKRFRNVFELAYRRFVDIEKAQAQAREAKIETALERVRSNTMAMHHSEELKEVISVTFEQIKSLDIIIDSCIITLFIEGSDDLNNWVASAEQKYPHKVRVPYFKHPLFDKIVLAKNNPGNYFTLKLSQKENQVFYKHILENSDFGKIINEDRRKLVMNADSNIMSFANFKHTGLRIGNFRNYTYTDEENNTILRFANVFEQTYTRFLDLQKAEAQAREAQIETALERVRSRTMGMQKSEELKEVIQVVYDQLVHLNILVEHAGFIMDYKERDDMHIWLADQHEVPSQVIIPYFDCAHWNSFNEAKEKGMDFFANNLTFEEKNRFYQDLFKLIPGLPEEAKEYYFSCPGLAISTVLLENVGLYIENFSGIPYTDEENNTLMRFGKVFQQTYTRFLDLQKAEAQAREAKIEAALERARTQSMLMQHSNELNDTLRVFHQQVLLLGINSAFSFLWLPDEDKDRHIFWAAWAENNTTVFKSKATNYPLDRNEPATAQCLIDWKSGQPVISYHVPPEAVESYFAAWQELLAGVEHLKPEYFSGGLYYVEAFIKYGCFGVMVESQLSEEEKKILGRFAVEFERAYTRFLDLQKAEAQAREAQIEAALERVRAKVMAMTNSKELNETSLVFGEQLRKLDVDWQFSYFWLVDEANNENTFWITWPDYKTSFTTYTLAEAEQYFNDCLISWRAGVKIHDNYVPPEGVQAWLDTFQRIADDAGGEAKRIMVYDTFSKGVYYYDAMMKYGSFGICINKPATDEEKNIQCRFAIEFERAYTRFLDLQKAEAQTREALIEGALERVRARALAMQQAEELKDVAQVLRNEMAALGVEELETCSIYIHGDSSEKVECWYALQDPKHTEKKMVSDHFVLNLDDTWVGREMKEFYGSGEKQTSIVMQGMNRKEWINYCYEHSPVFSGFYGETIPDRTYHLYKFSHGYIGAAAPGDISGESWKLLGRAASVFSLAYSRFKDLTQAKNDLIKLKEEKKRAEDALTELQATQKQLIQTEKMASLGELTAGIAHEIQNPLNFVNNFSDVSNELLEEMKAELEKGNAEEAKAIAGDVKENLEKILHHGKRADAIVKGMLQHSRNSSGQKELTDINVLADEYLRLAYHGLRAKDKFFNAKFETDLDPSINKINIVPQEIGRVILNLINNSFYAVSEKKKSASNGYEPSVMVSTKKINARPDDPLGRDKVEIRVKDNGNGIPQKVLDKIFQPFFTTKPTGQGTGLGLSLSYDIITKGHDGEIKVETKEGEGSAFIISLPMK